MSVSARPAHDTSRTLLDFALLSFLDIRTDPTAPMRLVSVSCTPRVILAQSSRAAIFIFHRRDSAASDRIIFEQASAGINSRGAARYCLAGVRRYTPYIDGRI